MQVGKSENHIRDQIRSPLDKYFWRKPKTKCQRTENPLTTMNTQSELNEILWQKNRSWKNIENCNAPLKDETVSSVHKSNKWWHNNHYYRWNLHENFFIMTSFESETCCKTTLITRYFFQGRCHVTQSNYSSTTNIDAWHLVNCTAAASRNFMLNYRSACYG